MTICTLHTVVSHMTEYNLEVLSLNFMLRQVPMLPL